MKSLKSSTYDLRFFWFHTQKYICIVFPPLKDGVYVVIVLMGYLAKTSKIPKSQEQLFLPCSFLPMRKAAGPRPEALNQGVSRNEGLIQLLMPNPSTGSNNRKGGCHWSHVLRTERVSYVPQLPGPHTVPGRGAQ